jgi:uncharacterized protein YecE (DUF72 family)
MANGPGSAAGATVRVGTSGFAYPEWKGSFYPTDLPASRMLTYYAQRFDTVEINATFYRMPTPRTLAGWAALTPERFVFALKAPQRITHVARLRGVDDSVRAFVEAALTLGARLGPVLFQLPPSLPRDLDRLDGLLRLLPAGVRVAVEFRHPTWFTGAVYERLRAAGAALCIADTEDGTTPLTATADFGYLRLRDADYDDAALDRWVEAIRGRWREAWVYFKHEASGRGPALAARLRSRLSA